MQSECSWNNNKPEIVSSSFFQACNFFLNGTLAFLYNPALYYAGGKKASLFPLHKSNYSSSFSLIKYLGEEEDFSLFILIRHVDLITKFSMFDL